MAEYDKSPTEQVQEIEKLVADAAETLDQVRHALATLRARLDEENAAPDA
jgi:esterase/lipase